MTASTPDSSFADLMDRLRSADEQAARSVFDRFAARLVGLASRRLGTQLRQKLDPEDVVQSVFRSFFLNGPRDLAGWDNLWSLLVVITLRKCGRRVAYFRAACRDVTREMPREGGTPAGPGEGEDPAGLDPSGAEPTPEEAAILAETVERLLGRLKDWEQTVVRLSLQGVPIPEISAKINRTERTVYRVLEQVRQHLEGQAGAG